MLKLIRPSVEYKQEYVDLCAECLNDKQGDVSGYTQYYGSLHSLANDDFENNIVNPFLDIKNCQPALNWGVDTTHMWCINENKNLVGFVDIRHKLTDDNKVNGSGNLGSFIRPSERGKGRGKEMLCLATQYAHHIKINEVLVCCEESNIASKKIIEYHKNIFGGDKIANSQSDGRVFLRYLLKSKSL